MVSILHFHTVAGILVWKICCIAIKSATKSKHLFLSHLGCFSPLFVTKKTTLCSHVQDRCTDLHLSDHLGEVYWPFSGCFNNSYFQQSLLRASVSGSILLPFILADRSCKDCMTWKPVLNNKTNTFSLTFSTPGLLKSVLRSLWSQKSFRVVGGGGSCNGGGGCLLFCGMLLKKVCCVAAELGNLFCLSKNKKRKKLGDIF